MRLGTGLVLALMAVFPTAARADLPELARVNVVEAGTHAFVDVRIPHSLRLEDVTKATLPMPVDGGGDYVRLDLRRLSGSLGFGFDRMGPPERRVNSGFGTVADTRALLPAGAYRMYLHTSEPVRVTLRVPALSGARVFRPRRPAAGTAALRLEPLSPMPPNASGFGGSADLTTEGEVNFLGLWGDGGTVKRWEVCSYRGGDGAAVAPYRPGCPQGSGAGAVMVSDTEGGFGISSTHFGVPAGRHGVGANLTTPDGAREPLYGLAAFTSYDQSAPVLGEGAPVVEELSGPPPAPPMPAAVVPLPRLRTQVARVRRGRALLRLACPAGTLSCVGTARIGRAREVPFSVRPGRTAVVRLPVARGARGRVALTLRTAQLRRRMAVRLRR